MKRDIQSKIKSISELASELQALRNKGSTIVHCHGVFDLLHPGHIKYFEAARKKGDVLVVTVTPDHYVNRGPGRPVFNQLLRAESIASIECVDFVAINEWATAVETIKKLRPHFYVKGSDYAEKAKDLTGKIYEEEKAVKEAGGSIYFTNEISFSSSSLINTFLSPYPEETKDFLLKFKRRFSSDDLIAFLKKTEQVKILVIGDVIIDEYHYCVGVGKSQKDNIIATKFLNEEIFAGGVLAAANHVAGFSKNVTLATSVNMKNSYLKFINNHLNPRIKKEFFANTDSQTVVKRRFIDPHFLTKLFEICYLEETPHPKLSLENRIFDYLKANLNKFDMVIVTDFGHGLITPRIVEMLCKKANFLAVNTQTNSANMGFNLITKFPRADYICIDEPELRLACHDRVSGLEKLILQISKQLRCNKIIITRGHRGSMVYSKDKGFTTIPVFSTQIVDRIGAGDAYFSITAPCVYKNIPMEAVGFIGNAVGATKVLIVGNRSAVEPVPLFKYIVTLLK